MSPSGSRMQTGGTSRAARPVCRRASRRNAAGANTDGAAGSLLARIGGFGTSVCRNELRALEGCPREKSRHSDRAASDPDYFSRGVGEDHATIGGLRAEETAPIVQARANAA